MSTTDNFKPFHHEEIQSDLFSWWAGLEHNKGERAQLRRCRNPSDALLQTGFFRLYQTLGKPRHLSRKKLAEVAGLLAHVRENIQSQSVGQLLGQSDGDSPLLSEARFRRLLHFDEVEDVYHPIIRVIRQLDYQLPVSRFANLIFYWEQDSTRQNLAFDYYETIPLARQEA